MKKIHPLDKNEEKESSPKVGAIWMHPFTGTEYRWDGKAWINTNKQPYGPNPMGLMG
jgi:hypothetical protein